MYPPKKWVNIRKLWMFWTLVSVPNTETWFRFPIPKPGFGRTLLTYSVKTILSTWHFWTAFWYFSTITVVIPKIHLSDESVTNIITISRNIPIKWKILLSEYADSSRQFLNGFEWIINMEFCLQKLLIFELAVKKCFFLTHDCRSLLLNRFTVH